MYTGRKYSVVENLIDFTVDVVDKIYSKTNSSEFLEVIYHETMTVNKSS